MRLVVILVIVLRVLVIAVILIVLVVGIVLIAVLLLHRLYSFLCIGGLSRTRSLRERARIYSIKHKSLLDRTENIAKQRGKQHGKK